MAAKSPPPARTPQVYVVDDTPALCEALCLLLETEGFAAKGFDSPVAFLASVDASSTGCLLLDMRMPEMDGLAVMAQLTQRGANLAVIVMTGFGDVPTAVEAMKHGAIEFLAKPIGDAQLMSAVRRALAVADEGKEARDEVANVQSRIGTLTSRERDVLGHIVAGSSNKDTARKLDISPRTVEIHRRRVMEKMQADSLSHLVRMALQAGVTPAE